MAANFADAIQNALVATASSFSFPRVSYAVQATAGAQTTAVMDTVSAKTILAWEAGAEFDLSPRQRRDTRRRERSNWTWFLQIAFDSPVSLVEFENQLLATAPRVTRNPSIGVEQQVDLLVLSAEYETPVTQQPSRGKKVTYRFQAQLTPY